MNKAPLVLLGLLLAGSIVLSACSQAPAVVSDPYTPGAPGTQDEASQPQPTLEPTPQPVLPCSIVFDSDRDGNLEIYSMDPEGGSQVNLTNHPADDTDPVWSPDGAQIAFVSNRETEEGSGFNIYVMSADGSDVSQVSRDGDGHYPDWSPQGDRIVYSSWGDIFFINLDDGNAVNLTNSPEQDQQPKFSPDGQRIAWLSGEAPNRQVFSMNLDGSGVFQVTRGGSVEGVEWTVDGRLFAHWNQPDGICFNCVVSADGSEVIDAGGKGTIQQFLPFWTTDGERVEMASADFTGSGRDDIILIGEIFPDIFKYLTSDAGHNRHPDTPARCGPYHGADPDAVGTSLSMDDSSESVQEGKLVIGYTGSIDPLSQNGYDVACAELDVVCVRGESVADLAEQGVDAIVNSSNRWDVYGSGPQVHDAVSRGIPVFMLNAVNPEQGVYNLSGEEEAISVALTWMFEQMGKEGDFIYYNFGNSDYVQNMIDALLKDYPGITSTEIEVSFDQNPFTSGEIQSRIAANPNLGAIWSSNPSTDLFWAAVDQANSHIPLMECPAREDVLTAWKGELDAGSALQCVSLVRPGGTAYEGVYVAYYYLNGYEFNSDNLTGERRNTLRYVMPQITNQTLPEWLDKLDSFIVGGDSQLQLPPMDPQQILQTWFIQ